MSLTSIIGPDMILDVVKLKQVDYASLVKFLSDNGKELTQRINETAKIQLMKGEVSGHEPEFASDPEFKAKWFSSWYRSIQGRLCRSSSKGSALPLILPIAVYLYECYGLSPSKLILGCEARTELPLWFQNWLAQTEKLSESESAKLYEILDGGQKVRCDTVYTLMSRVTEMAAERGIRPDDFCFYPGMLRTDYPAISDFAAASFKETGNSYATMKPFLGNHKMLRFIISLCVIYQVSVEYLLLQDYSEFAVTPQGRYYPPATRQLISLMLSVDSATRIKATGYVFAVTAAHAAAGGKVPSVNLSSENSKGMAGAPISVMETISAAGNASTRKKIEKQIVEDLKVKLYDILLRSEGPVSSTSLYTVVDGHARLARKALLLLESEGKIVKIPKERSAAFWEVKKKKK